MHFADAVSNDMKAQPDVKAYFERFYTISDTPEAHEDYAHSFTDGATLIMASKVAKGQNEILDLRKGMWTQVTSRHHSIARIFGSGNDEVMLYGNVKYTLKNGNDASVDWGARAHFAGSGAKLKMDFYQVYLDTAAMAAAAAKSK